jgi:hypothetical protein
MPFGSSSSNKTNLQNNNKKHKIMASSENDEIFAQVRQYILDCPVAPSDHPALQAALHGLDQELRRRTRNAKLQKKFSATSANPTAGDDDEEAVMVSSSTPMDHKDVTMESHKGNTMTSSIKTSVSNATSSSATDGNDKMISEPDDWQDIAASDTAPLHGSAQDNTASFIGQECSKIVIQSLSQSACTVQSPAGVLAIALHAALRSPLLGFACTGIPEDASNNGGFAPPIRELPAEVFVPAHWEKAGLPIRLRYRKQGTGSVILQVKTEEDSTHAMQASVSLNPTNSNTEPTSESWNFPLADFVNLDSWARGAAKGSSVAPALHYKSLSLFLTQFCHRFDLGPMPDSDETLTEKNTLPYVDTSIRTVVPPPALVDPFPKNALPVDNDPTRMEFHDHNHQYDHFSSPRIDTAFPTRPSRPMDFGSDLWPGGLPPWGAGGPGTNPGMLMGPHHPAFFGEQGPPGPPGLGMRPRFDPYGPPGGPTDGGHRRGPPGGPGNPNPDHLPPPGASSSHFYS